ncbi:hypothetical protein ACSMXN_03760 [Jatrophihabitans sp. DSM 45814]
MIDDRLKRPISDEDLAISIAVRNDIGPEHDDAVISEFLDRVGWAIDERVDTRMAGHQAGAANGYQPAAQSNQGGRSDRAGARTFIAAASLITGIPVTAIALGTTHGGLSGIIAMVIGWTGIAAINIAHAHQR